MVTGSLVSSMQGQPRSTHDIDLVVSLSPDTDLYLNAAFPEAEYYLDPESIREAVSSGGMFNLIEFATGDKVDFWLLTPEAYDQSRFGRRVRQALFGLVIPVTAPEDTILQKLRWMKLSGGSEKQFQDAVSVYEVQFEVLDQAYLEHWARELGLETELQRLRDKAIPL